jgi:hypothetical protein
MLKHVCMKLVSDRAAFLIAGTATTSLSRLLSNSLNPPPHLNSCQRMAAVAGQGQRMKDADWLPGGDDYAALYGAYGLPPPGAPPPYDGGAADTHDLQQQPPVPAHEVASDAYGAELAAVEDPAARRLLAHDSEPEPSELPPAYVDDIGCWNGFKREPHALCLVLTSALCVELALRYARVMDRTTFLVLVIITAVIYLLESAFSHTSRYLWNASSQREVLSVYEPRMRAEPLVITWTIQCYHYANRTHTTRTADGHTRTEHRRERVNTHAASVVYALNGCHDESPALQLSSHDLAKIHFQLAWRWATPQAEAVYNMHKANFIQQNQRDTHYDFSAREELAGFQSHLLITRRPDSKPWWVNWGVFAAATLCGLSFVYRCMFSRVCGKLEHAFRKVVW